MTPVAGQCKSNATKMMMILTKKNHWEYSFVLVATCAFRTCFTTLKITRLRWRTLIACAKLVRVQKKIMLIFFIEFGKWLVLYRSYWHFDWFIYNKFFCLSELKKKNLHNLFSSLGPNVLDVNNVFAKLKFVNCDNNVFIYKDYPDWNEVRMTERKKFVFIKNLKNNSLLFSQALMKLEYKQFSDYDDATKGIVMIDLDGSITGICGAAIVGTSPHLHHDLCEAKPQWNAHVCKPVRQILFIFIIIFFGKKWKFIKFYEK